MHSILFPSGLSFDRFRTIFERGARLGRSSFSFERVKDSFASYYYNIFITQQFITCGIRCVYLAVSAPCVTKKGRMCWTPPALLMAIMMLIVNISKYLLTVKLIINTLLIIKDILTSAGDNQSSLLHHCIFSLRTRDLSRYTKITVAGGQIAILIMNSMRMI
jgi:hypothetical protein